MKKIIFSSDVPDSAYFTTINAQPTIDSDNNIILYQGNGHKRSWGAPGVNSVVVFQSETLIAVHVGFHHKHRGGQFWRYFRLSETGILQIGWKDLPDAERQLVLDGYEKNAPDWAKTPGKLKANYKKPSKHDVGFKLVGVREDRFFSLFDGVTEYIIGETKKEEEKPNHQGGFYYYLDIADARKFRKLANSKLTTGFDQLALLKVEAWGKRVSYPGRGKYSATYLKPLEIVEVFQ